MGVTELANKAAFDNAIKENKLVLLDCHAVWCGPCKFIAPVIEKFSEDHTAVKFFKLDVDEVADVAEELGIRAMPTFILFKDGKKFTEVVGANRKAIEAAIEKLNGCKEEESAEKTTTPAATEK
ncbi:MAG: Cytoplasmic thioredoxin isoenzyme 2 [Geoglossum umbratile]|nr:MAG: Cytoplasmic thioredoxin isoenzyme 2 [Geoglossum umbratile]